MENKLFLDRGYLLIKPLYRSRFGVRVLLGRCQRSNREVALKFKEPNPLDENEKRDSDSVQIEADILADLDHANIIKFIDVFKVDQISVLVMEVAPGGTLAGLIRTNRKLHNEQAQSLTNQLADALTYLHGRNIAHCDVKSENILLDEYKNAKLGDFGFAENINNPSRAESTWKGSLSFASPEVIQGWSRDRMKGDVWSLGVVVFHMVTGYLPFGTLDAEDLLKRIAEPLRWPRPLTLVDARCRDFVGMALEQEENKRPTVGQMTSHNWLLHRTK